MLAPSAGAGDEPFRRVADVLERRTRDTDSGVGHRDQQDLVGRRRRA